MVPATTQLGADQLAAYQVGLFGIVRQGLHQGLQVFRNGRGKVQILPCGWMRKIQLQGMQGLAGKLLQHALWCSNHGSEEARSKEWGGPRLCAPPAEHSQNAERQWQHCLCIARGSVRPFACRAAQRLWLWQWPAPR